MKKNLGFTLVEMVIVIAILGVLAIVAVPRFTSMSDQAEQAATEAAAGGFKEAIRMATLRWQTDGKPTDRALDLDADPNTTDDLVCFKAGNNFPQGVTCPVPDGFTVTASECVDLFHALFKNSNFPADVLVNDVQCYFIYDSENPVDIATGSRLSSNADKLSSDVPRFQYDPETGVVTTVLTDE